MHSLSEYESVDLVSSYFLKPVLNGKVAEKNVFLS